jgi:N-acetyl-beta-hexosaminidase
MTTYWGSIMESTDDWTHMRTRKGYELSAELQSLFVEYVKKTLTESGDDSSCAT